MNCNALMKPGKITKKFCGPEDPGKGQCKNEYHRHGSAFGPLKTRLENLVTKLTRETFKGLTADIEALASRVKDLEYPDDPLS
jgi:hypothetical protein